MWIDKDFHKYILFFRNKLKFGSAIDPRRVSFPNEAKVVIVGGGAQGMAIAYKLAKEKYGRDIVVIDQVLRLRLNTIENDYFYQILIFLVVPSF